MTLKIYISNKKANGSKGNLVLFVDEKFNINHLKKYISNSEYLYINDLLKNSDLKKNILSFDSLIDNKFCLLIVIKINFLYFLIKNSRQVATVTVTVKNIRVSKLPLPK